MYGYFLSEKLFGAPSIISRPICGVLESWAKNYIRQKKTNTKRPESNCWMIFRRPFYWGPFKVGVILFLKSSGHIRPQNPADLPPGRREHASGVGQRWTSFPFHFHLEDGRTTCVAWLMAVRVGASELHDLIAKTPENNQKTGDFTHFNRVFPLETIHFGG